MSQGLGAAAPLAKPLLFGQKLIFSGKSQQPKMKNIYIFVFIKFITRKKRNLFRLAR